jgi:transcriptional regulator with XRE-family HTH domain
MNAGDRLRVLREARKRTQADLADSTGYSRGYLAQVECGMQDGADRFWIAMAHALGCQREAFASDAGLGSAIAGG